MQVSRSLLSKKIGNCFPFNTLDEAGISGVIDNSEVLFFENGQLIFQEGTAGSHIYLLLEGEVSILREMSTSVQQINKKTEGMIFGQDALYENRDRQATAKAEANLMVLKIPASYLSNISKVNPSLDKSLEVLKTSYINLLRSREIAPPNESIFYFGRPHIFLYVGHLILPVMLLGGFIAAFVLVTGNITGVSGILLTAGSILMLASILLWQYLEWRRNITLITDKRVISYDVRLLRFEAVMDTPLDTVMNIRLIKPLAGKLFDFGDLTVDTFTGENNIRAVPMADRVQALIEFLLTSARAESLAREQETFKIILENQQGSSGSAENEITASSKDGRIGILREGSNEPAFLFRTHWIVLFKKVLLPTLLFALVVLTSSFLYLNNLIFSENLLVFSLFFIALSISVIWWIFHFFDWYNDRYLIINDQVIDINQKPFGREDRRTASIFNIQSLRFEKKGLLGILLNYGTVFIRIGDEEFTFDKVPDPAQVQEQIFRALKKSVSGKEKRELTSQQIRLANWLDAYQQFQRDRDKQPE